VVKKIHSYAATNEPFENTITFLQGKIESQNCKNSYAKSKVPKIKSAQNKNTGDIRALQFFVSKPNLKLNEDT